MADSAKRVALEGLDAAAFGREDTERSSTASAQYARSLGSRRTDAVKRRTSVGEHGADRAGKAFRSSRAIARVVRAELRGKDPRWIAQMHSPLGSREHCAAVRRRLAESAAGERLIAGALIEGQRFLLSQEALAEELGRRTEP